MPTESGSPAHLLLDAIYHDLDFESGLLLDTAELPDPGITADQWVDRGEWLLLGHRMGAERIFFVQDDPVVLFTTVPPTASESDIVAQYRKAWSMGRAKCLFLATDSELRIYALNDPPPRTLDDIQGLKPIDIVERSINVAERLADYHREKLESGSLFESSEYSERSQRADEQLLQDVREATEALVGQGLNRSTAHTLIERVILVRYLEDRRAIGPEYFIRIAQKVPEWDAVMRSAPDSPSLGADSTFVSCLADRAFTYAVFDQLAQTFNGDMFVVADDELESVTSENLYLIQRLLTGAGIDGQQPLFLWAYDFSIVPTSLIGSMYEQFYRSDVEDASSTHYTPPELAEYVIARTLTPEIMATAPKVCDPACGSGVFLVEAFRRIVRYEMTQQPGRLTTEKLKRLLLTRVAGIDVNSEAIKLAAFSLYLAYLNYQEPPDIATGGPLPLLIYRPGAKDGSSVLIVADAFTPFRLETLGRHIVDQARADTSKTSVDVLPWHAQEFDIVVGNPPWDEPRGGKQTPAERWAGENDLPIGDRSPSQLFLWRALSFLRPQGRAALLVAATALHNARSRDFRRAWLRRVAISSVTDFTSARRLFFSATAPFALVIYGHQEEDSVSERLLYQSVRPSESLESGRSMSYARTDQRWVDQIALYDRDYLWKTYAWGGHRDAALMARLDVETQLRQVVPHNPSPGWGYQRGDKNKSLEPSEYLKSLPSLRRFEIYGPIEPRHFEDPPTTVKRQPDERLYSGQRILVTEGIRPGFGPAARLVYDEFSFRHIIYCMPLPVMESWQAKVILATLISSLGRYRMFMHGSSWGLWRDKVNAEDIMSVPIRLSNVPGELELQVAELVDRLMLDTPSDDMLSGIFALNDAEPDAYSVDQLLKQINEGIFELFELSRAERDLIDDFDSYTLPITANWKKAGGLRSFPVPKRRMGTAVDLGPIEGTVIGRYLDRFLAEWGRMLPEDAEFSWEIAASLRTGLLGTVFEIQQRNSVSREREIVGDEWGSVLTRLEHALSNPDSPALNSDVILRSVSDTSIVIVKRREARLWSASTAREDAEATMLQAMRLEDA